MSTPATAPYRLIQRRPEYRETLVYAATFQKYEEWLEVIIVDGKLVWVDMKGYRTYSTGPYVAGRNELKRKHKAAHKRMRLDMLRFAKEGGIPTMPKMKLTMKRFIETRQAPNA